MVMEVVVVDAVVVVATVEFILIKNFTGSFHIENFIIINLS
jgi:hypothetical protein